MADRKIDKILVSILQRRFKSIAEEMSIAITMTTRSPILCEAQVFVTATEGGEIRDLLSAESRLFTIEGGRARTMENPT